MKNQNDVTEPEKRQDHAKEILIIIGIALLLLVVICFAAGGGMVIGVAEVISQLDGIS